MLKSSKALLVELFVKAHRLVHGIRVGRVHPATDIVECCIVCIVCTDDMPTRRTMRCCNQHICEACEARWASECVCAHCSVPTCPVCRATLEVGHREVAARKAYLKALIEMFDRSVDATLYPKLNAVAGTVMLIEDARTSLDLVSNIKYDEMMLSPGAALSMWQSVFTVANVNALRRLVALAHGFPVLETMMTGDLRLDGLLTLFLVSVSF